jgi:hypothetical protein
MNETFLTEEEEKKYYRAEALAFVHTHPEYYPDDDEANMRALFGELVARELTLNRENLATVYQALSEQGKLIPRPKVTVQ